MELVKRIPLAAGLGGGSSNAAAALQLANRAWNLGWSRRRLAEVAAEVGSDVPFFLGRGAAVCRGRGEQVEALRPSRRLHFVIVKPAQGLATCDVYRAHDRLAAAGDRGSDKPIAALIRSWGRCALGDVGRGMVNRLQAAAAELSPWVARSAEAFDRLDVLGHQLTGSGTAYFALCRHGQHARRLASLRGIRKLGLVYVTHSQC